MLTIDLIGPLQVLAPDGANLTPRSAKARGMVALLATSKSCQRSRKWLQGKLWSDRGREQAAASLRQVLSETRKALGAHSLCLIANRTEVSFDPHAIRVRDTQSSDDPLEFLEGLDVRDEEFEDWLRIERMRRDSGAAPQTAGAINRSDPGRAAPYVLLINETSSTDAMERFFSEHFSDSVARSLSEVLFAEIGVSATPSKLKPDLILRTSASLSQSLAGLRISMEQNAPNQQIWAGSELVQSKGTPPVEHENVLRLINNAAEGIVAAIQSQEQALGGGMSAHALARRALRLMFTMEPEKHLQADGFFNIAFELQPNGLFLAWRALLRVLMLVERHDANMAFTPDEALEFSSKALELEPLNSLVLAAAANTALIIEGNSEKGQELAMRATRINPANPFALDAAAMAALYCGDVKAAHRLQLRAKYISGNTQFSHWFDMGCAMTSTALCDFEKGLLMAQRAASIAPSFRPPLRYAIALHLRSGQIDKAHEAMLRLKAVEPGFSPERLWDDDEYPVRDLRRNEDLLGRLKELR